MTTYNMTIWFNTRHENDDTDYNDQLIAAVNQALKDAGTTVVFNDLLDIGDIACHESNKAEEVHWLSDIKEVA